LDKKSVIVLGSGFAGMAAASFLSRDGWDVTVIEKNEGPGGRARQLKENGFTFDMGPSFYWMPDVFERYFQSFGRSARDYYTLHRLDPSYRIYWSDGFTDFPADLQRLKETFESIEPGSALQLEKFLKEAETKYRVAMEDMVFKPGLSITEFFNWKTIRGALQLDLLNSIKSHISKYFTHPRLRQAMEFPVLFLGALPEQTPSLYSLMNYADIVGGTWYPSGGMFSVVEGMYKLAIEQGVKFHFNENVTDLECRNARVMRVQTSAGTYQPDAVLSAADYHFTETKLLPAEYRSYDDIYWKRKVMAPSCLMFYVGLNKKLKRLAHHSLFFDVSFEKHGKEIYKFPCWPSEPLFYASVSSKSDEQAAPAGHENLVLLIPVAAGLENDDEAMRERYFEMIIRRMEKVTGESIMEAVIYKRSYSVSDFRNDYNSFRGNAYGLANTLKQTAIFRPSCRSRKLRNLFYAGQLTVPGPGVPPSLISGEIAATQLIKVFSK
jgi:phytoene desaturase